MKPTLDTLLAELRTRLEILRKSHRALPWVNVPRLDQLCRQTARVLQAPATRTERMKLERELWDLVSRMQGVYEAVQASRTLPPWLKPGRQKRVGQLKKTYLAEFFARLRQRSELTSAFTKLTNQSWREHERLYTRWRVLAARETKEAAAYPAAVRRLRKLLIAARGLTGVLN